MKIATCTLRSASPYGQSRNHNLPKKEKEGHDDYEKRTWMHRLHTKDGNIFIPGMAFKKCLEETAKYLGIQIPGRGKERFTKNFERGVLVVEDIQLPYTIDDVTEGKNGCWGESLFVPADGKPGSGRRVWKTFPVINDWEATVTFYVFDDTITKSVFEDVLQQAGMFTGIGFWRVANRGLKGRFDVVDVQWTEKN